MTATLLIAAAWGWRSRSQTSFGILRDGIFTVALIGKDLSRDGDAGHEAAGHGKLDYDRYLSPLHACGFRGPLLLHGLTEAQVPGCVAFLRDKLARVATQVKG